MANRTIPADPPKDVRHKEHRLGTSLHTEYLPGMIRETTTEVTPRIIRITVTETIFRATVDESRSVIGPVVPSATRMRDNEGEPFT